MTEEMTEEYKGITINGKDFGSSDLSEQAKAQLNNLEFVNQQILQKNNELQVADSARIMYVSALNEELLNTKSPE